MSDKRFPRHVAIILDGNGRWAQQRGRERTYGHQVGAANVKNIVRAAGHMGIRCLTIYAFSTENWKRPDKEVDFLMDLPVKFFNTFVPELIENNVRVNVMGYIDMLPKKTQKAVYDAIEQTSNCTGMILNFALNYGGRAELVSAIQSIASEVSENKLEIEKITEKVVDANLMTGKLAPYNDPDLLIRTSGEERISNFLLWQLAYSEFVFTDTLWPDYSEEDLLANIYTFQTRDRRFGGLKEEKK